MLMNLKSPLVQRQIAAAGRLHGRLNQWQISDRALALLAERLPGFDAEAVLLKAVAINELYGTNVFAIVRMARHVGEVLGRFDLGSAGPELVEALADLPPVVGQQHDRQHISFASKFAHFFVDTARFPIMDKYVIKMLNHHLGSRHRTRDDDHAYAAFVADVQNLRRLSGHEGSDRELDHYLWIAGLYRTWLRDHDAKINREMAALFSDPSEEIAADLAALLGDE